MMMPMRWEHQRLSMQKEDLEEKWREIQQTKLSKENQRALGESSQVMVFEAKGSTWLPKRYLKAQRFLKSAILSL